MEATSEAPIDLPALNGQFKSMTITVNGETRWGPVDGHEGDWGGYNSMTGSYEDNVFTSGRPFVTIGKTAVPHGRPDDWTSEPVQAGAVVYRIDGGEWHEFTGQSFTIDAGRDIELAYNDQHGGYVDDGTDRPSTVNSGHYDVVVTRTE